MKDLGTQTQQGYVRLRYVRAMEAIRPTKPESGYDFEISTDIICVYTCMRVYWKMHVICIYICMHFVTVDLYTAIFATRRDVYC